MEENQLTQEQKALTLIVKTLDHCVTKGALNRIDVLNYHAAIQILEKALFAEAPQLTVKE